MGGVGAAPRRLTQEEETRLDAWEWSAARADTEAPGEEDEGQGHGARALRGRKRTRGGAALSPGTATTATSAPSMRQDASGDPASVDALTLFSDGAGGQNSHPSRDSPASSAPQDPERRRAGESPYAFRLKDARENSAGSALCIVLDAQPVGSRQWGLQVADETCQFFPVVLTHRAAAWARAQARVGRVVYLQDVFFRKKGGSLHGFVGDEARCAAILQEPGRARKMLQHWAGPATAEAERLRDDFQKMHTNLRLHAGRGPRTLRSGRRDVAVGRCEIEPFDAVLHPSRLYDVVAVAGRVVSVTVHGRDPRRRMALLTLDEQEPSQEAFRGAHQGPGRAAEESAGEGGAQRTVGQVQLWGEKASDEHVAFLCGLRDRGARVVSSKCRVMYSYRRECYCLNEVFGNEVFASDHDPRPKVVQPLRFGSLAALRATKGLKDALVEVTAHIVGALEGPIVEPVGNEWSFSTAWVHLGDERLRRSIGSKTSSLRVNVSRDRLRELTCGLLPEDLRDPSLRQSFRARLAAERNPPLVFTLAYTRIFDEHGFPVAGAELAELQRIDFADKIV